MTRGERLKGDLLTVEEIVRRPQIVPGLGLFGKAPGWMCCDLGRQVHQSLGAALVMKVGSAKLGFGPSLGVHNKGIHPVLLRVNCDPSLPSPCHTWLDIPTTRARKPGKNRIT